MDAKGRVLSNEYIADEVPFEELPGGWAWARLSAIATFGGGKTPSTNDKSNYSDNGILWITSKDMKRDRIDSTLTTLSDKGASGLTLYGKDCIVMVTRSGILRRLLPVAILDRPATVNQDQKVILPNDTSLSEWLLCYFKGSDQRIRSDFGKDGTTVESIVFDKVKEMLVPLPPLAEQRRIVERVNDLMPLVEEYGGLEDAREKLDGALPARLRKSLLQMAVQGKLVPQDSADEPASALLERIRGQRRQLVAEKKMKAPKGGESVIYTGSDGRRYEKRVDAKGRESEPSCIEDEIPFEIPKGWEWARLESVARIMGGATPDKGNPEYWNGEISWASMKDIHGDYLRSTLDTITEAGLESKSSISMCAPGDLIVSTRLIPGKSIVSRIDAAINQDLKVLRLDEFDAVYLHLWFQSQLDYFKHIGSGTTVPGIKLGQLASSLIPIPPLPEQRRIVEKVERLASLMV